MGIGSSGVVNCANTYLGTANYTVADGYVADRTVIVGGNGPAQLNLNFARDEVLDPRITFSRTSNATRTNAQGLIEYAPHNLFDNSENLLSWLPGSGASITANATISPDGASTADLITGASSLGWLVANSIARQPAATLIPSTTYYGSIYVKAGTATTVTLQLRDQSTGATQQTTVTLTGSWQRISANITLGSATTAIGFILGNANGTFYAWGVQLNIGSLQPYYTTSVKNLLGYSQNFENAAWAKSNSTIDATPVMGPLGFLGAEKLVENTAAGVSHGMALDTSSLNSATQYTLSVYAKAGERTWIRLGLIDNLGTDGGRAWYDLTNGVLGTVETNGAGSNINATITSIGAGWYRCRLTIQMNNGKTTLQSQVILATANNVLSYTGDGSSGIYIFGAQLSDSASLDPYVYNFGAAPTSSAYYGPRFDYDPVTLAPKGLLIEEQRINILLNSDTLSTQSVSVTAQAYTLSFYGTGSVALSGAYTGSLVGTGVYPNRVQLTFTPTIGTLTLTVTGSVRYANLEAGSFPTSYIPTTSAQVTRAADNASMVGTNFSSWYNQSEGTFSVNIDSGNTANPLDTSGSARGALYVSDGTTTNRYRIGALVTTYIVTSEGVLSANISAGTLAANTNYKLASTYAVNSYQFANNGVLGTEDTSGALPIGVHQMQLGLSGLSTGYLNGYIQSIKYFSKRFLNTYLQSLTQ